MKKLVVTTGMLEDFGACDARRNEFGLHYRDGVDITGLWGDYRLRESTWKTLMKLPFVKEYLNWGICEGLLPGILVGRMADEFMEGVNLSGAKLTELVFTHSTWINCNFSYAALYTSQMDRARFIDCQFTRADLTGAYVAGTRFIRCSFHGAKMETLVASTPAVYVNCRASESTEFGEREMPLGIVIPTY